MAIRKPKPTSPGRRFSTYADFAEITKSSRRRASSRACASPAGATPTGARPRATAAAGQAPVSQDRLQAPQGRDPGEGRGDRVRPQPLVVHRAAALRRRREALHPRAEPAARRCDGAVRAGRRDRVGNSLPLVNMPVGTVVHNVELEPGRGGQMGRSAGAAIQLMAKDGDMATLRLPSGEMRMVRASAAPRSARSATPTTRTSRSARPAASATWACARRRAAPP